MLPKSTIAEKRKNGRFLDDTVPHRVKNVGLNSPLIGHA